MKGWYVNMSVAKKRPHMETITERFSPDVMQILGQIAEDNCLSKAQVVRLATDGKLYQYLRDIKIVSPADAAAIRAEIKALTDATRKAEYELHKIGVNLNQIARAMNYMLKSGQSWPDGIGSTYLMRQELLDIILRYEEASGRAGEELCRILG